MGHQDGARYNLSYQHDAHKIENHYIGKELVRLYTHTLHKQWVLLLRFAAQFGDTLKVELPISLLNKLRLDATVKINYRHRIVRKKEPDKTEK